MPSAIVATSSNGTGLPALRAANALAAPSGSTPITLMLGFFNLAAAAIPDTMPPPLQERVIHLHQAIPQELRVQ